ACGTMVDTALDAQRRLKKKKISAKIIDMHTIKPLDEKLVLKCAKETGHIITVEEHSVIGGLGAAVAETLAEQSRNPVGFYRMGIRDHFCESGDPADLLKKYKLDPTAITKTAEKLVSD
ncbi:MAG TPA: transketolase C-terminal domain-containing protein, partial [Candidatus Thermoplasmatota archaeon]|nr:transketolase C-terminal domain-containing protein [Candidatus Thermoplasmatota archaeon]